MAEVLVLVEHADGAPKKVTAELITAARVLGEPAAVVRGLHRARIGSGVPGPGAALWVESTPFDEPEPTGRTRELAREYRTLITADLQRRGAWQVIDAVERMEDPAQLADSAGYAPWLSVSQKAQLLEAADVDRRLELLIEWARAHLAEQEVAEKLADEVREGLERSQREFLLRQQLNAIRKELGEDEPDGAADYRARVEQADLPEKVREAALREVNRLERASDASPEAGWIRTWLDTVLELPWHVRTEDNTDLAAARAVLDADDSGDDATGHRLTVVPATLAKGLEYDHVIVVEPAEIAEAEPRGLARLYVVLTRAVTTLTVLHTRPLPPQLAS